MKIGRFTLSFASLTLLVIQLVLVSSIAAKYLYQRWTCPRVWTVAEAYDPELPMRGRYLQTQLVVDGCQSTLPSAKAAQFPRDFSGAVKPGPYALRAVPVTFRANLKVQNNRLVAVLIEGDESGRAGQEVSGVPDWPCDKMHLTTPTDFYIAEHAASPLPLKQGQELWIEVTIPPKGPPRPIQMALKDSGLWKPLGFE
jgi:hypothetical protein